MTCFIGFSCVQQRLERTDEKTVAEGASVIHARFELCSKWDGLTVYARFRHGAACYDVPIKGSAALIPWEVLKPTGFEVSVWGEDGEGGKLTSAAVFVDVAKTISLDGFEPIPSSPTLIGKFTEQVTAAAESARIAQEANAATVAVGTVATGEAGTAASVTNSGSNMAAVFDFVIPRGENGERLPDGGSVGQVLTFTEGGAVWADAQGGGGSVDFDFPITVEQGGTGATTAAGALVTLGAAAAEHEHTLDELGAAAAEHEHTAGDITSGTLGVARGGTGKATHTANAVLTGNGTNAVQNVATAAGALYATAANGAAKFGTLPVAQGGTGVTTNAALGLKAYPVGAVYISYVSTSPAELFGGTWTPIKGRFPYFNAGTSTGGSNTHTLTVAQIPSHTHGWKGYTNGPVTDGEYLYALFGNDEAELNGKGPQAAGGGAAHNNMPAYQTLYAWRRTA